MQAEPVTNFEGDLANGVVLFSLLLNHWPGFASRKSKLHLVPSDGKDLRENADLVVKCMQVGLAEMTPLNEPTFTLLLLCRIGIMFSYVAEQTLGCARYTPETYDL